MTAQQNAAVAELVISLIAIVAVVAAYPWLGSRAMGMFGLLGLLGLTPLLLVRRQKHQILSDERDQSIAMRATFFGIGFAWMFLFSAIAILTLLIDFAGNAVPKEILSLILWIQFALCYCVKGATALYLYRVRDHAAQV